MTLGFQDACTCHAAVHADINTCECDMSKPHVTKISSYFDDFCVFESIFPEKYYFCPPGKFDLGDKICHFSESRFSGKNMIMTVRFEAFS